jgi:hypothetical protein
MRCAARARGCRARRGARPRAIAGCRSRVTGHSAQGLNATRVILEKDTRPRTTNHRSFYTDLTRAREAALVVTDSAQRLVQLGRSDLPKFCSPGYRAIDWD